MRILIIIALILFCSCIQQNRNKRITIVNIGNLDRIGIGKVLNIVNLHNPTVIGINFLIRKDSLSKDSILRIEFLKAKKAVHSIQLRNYDEDLKYWTYQIHPHSKFQAHHSGGFTNLLIKDGEIIDLFSLHEKVKDSIINSFSYQIAKEAGGIKEKYLSNEEIYDLEILDQKPYDTISAADILNNKFDPKLINSRIVILGYLGPGNEDLFKLKNKNKIYGVEVHANIINQLLK